jgi:hypothetical protein
MPAWGKCKKNFHFFNTDASDIIAEGECHMPELFLTYIKPYLARNCKISTFSPPNRDF